MAHPPSPQATVCHKVEARDGRCFSEDDSRDHSTEGAALSFASLVPLFDGSVSRFSCYSASGQKRNKKRKRENKKQMTTNTTTARERLWVSHKGLKQLFVYFFFYEVLNHKADKNGRLKKKGRKPRCAEGTNCYSSAPCTTAELGCFCSRCPFSPLLKKKKKRKSSTSHVRLSPSGQAYRLLKGASILTSTRGIAVPFFFLHVWYVILPHCHIKETERKQTNKQKKLLGSAKVQTH